MILRLSVALSVIALLVLAGLQYHWIGQIADAERLRLERSVAESSREFADDFAAELRSLGNALEPRFSPVLMDPSLIATRYHDWMANTSYPNLVHALYIVRPPKDALRLNVASGTFEPASLADLSSPESLRMTFGRRFPGLRGQDGPGFREFPNPPDREAESAIVVELDRDVIVEQLLPRLVTRRFTDYEGRDYRVAVVAALQGSARQTVFTSGEWNATDLESPDFAMDLFGPGPPLPRRGVGAGIPPPQRGGRGGERGRGDQRGPIMSFAGQNNWQLLVKHRAGSVQTAVDAFRTRNLAISFGVLVVLGISAVAIMISTAKARRLGRLQMEFAAGISHELRTPLAVIQSAAHNLRSGVVKDEEGIQEYAEMVSSEARRLTETIEQVMAYTETQSGNKRYSLSAVDVADIIDIATSGMANVLREGEVTIQKDVEPDLPAVIADTSALTRCLQNLLSNSVKYGQGGNYPTIEILGRHIRQQGSAGKVELSVVDHGTGVPAGDVASLFEPFHRGINASTNTPGNGLGLHLVERMMKAQNGSIRYEPAPGGGAKFTLTLQVAAGSV